MFSSKPGPAGADLRELGRGGVGAAAAGGRRLRRGRRRLPGRAPQEEPNQVGTAPKICQYAY